MPEDDPPSDPIAGVDATDLGAVAGVLYRLDPAGFVAARTAFVKAARAAGDRDVARQVQALGRPTRAAWVLNRLARDAPDVVAGLVELGTELTAAQVDLDATALRELSERRRALVRDVSRQAFDLVGDPAPSSALAVEVQDTLTAAVVDPAVGEALQGGALLKAAQASGFGPAGPELAAVPRPRTLQAATPTTTPATTPGKAAGPAKAAATSARGSATSAGPSAGAGKARAAARRQEEKARAAAEARAAEKRERVAAADRALSAAQSGLEDARSAEKDAQERVRILREQVRDADRAAGDAGLAVREARAAVREAERHRRETR